MHVKNKKKLKVDTADTVGGSPNSRAADCVGAKCVGAQTTAS